MRVIFVTANRFPKEGACTSLLKNLFFKGGLLERCDKIDILVADDLYSDIQAENYNGITVYHLNCLQKISVRDYKRIFFRHPIVTIIGMLRKTISKKRKTIVDPINCKSIERKLNKICFEKYDVIFTVMGTLDTVPACLKYKQNNPDIKLVVYQVDPCVSNEAYKPQTLEERQSFESELYETADRIITTPILLEESKQIYPQSIIDKMVAMEFPNVVPGYEDESVDGEKIRCLFTGLIYGDFRDPTYTFRLFDKLDEGTDFEIIGSITSPFDEEAKKHRVICHGRKSLDETKDELRKAHILVNIGNRMTNQVPSKIFEYISYGKPIVNICKNRNCPSLSYLENYPYVLNLFEEEDCFEEQAEKLNAFIKETYNKRISAEEIERLYEKCTPKFCAKQMWETINN